MTCPFCDADSPELISLFGSQLLLSQYRCRACGTYFEGLRKDREENEPDEGPDTLPYRDTRSARNEGYARADEEIA